MLARSGAPALASMVRALDHNDSERTMKTTCVLCTRGPQVGIVCLHNYIASEFKCCEVVGPAMLNTSLRHSIFATYVHSRTQVH